MKILRTSIIFLVVLIGVVLNLERLDIGESHNLINIQSFTYLLYGAVVISSLAIPLARQLSISFLWIGWVVIYFICKLVVFPDRPLVGGVYTYLTITELSLLTLFLVMSYRVSNNLFAIEETVANITLKDVSSRVVNYDEANDDIARELLRSRRYNTPLSVLIIKVDPESDSYIEEKALKDFQQSMLVRYVSSSLVRVLDKELRRIDMIIKQPSKNQLVLVFPETGSDGTRAMVERISNLSKQRLGISVSCGYAAFPDDALTFDELVQQAESYLKDHSSHFADFVTEKVQEASFSTREQN